MSKLVVIIRRDGLTGAQQAVQAGHAVAQWLIAFPAVWLNATLVYIMVEKEDDLLAYASLFRDKDIDYICYWDCDLGTSYTALATADPRAWAHTKRLPLWTPPCK